MMMYEGSILGVSQDLRDSFLYS